MIVVQLIVRESTCTADEVHGTDETFIAKPSEHGFFLIAGCIGSLGYWQSLTTRE